MSLFFFEVSLHTGRARGMAGARQTAREEGCALMEEARPRPSGGGGRKTTGEERENPKNAAPFEKGGIPDVQVDDDPETASSYLCTISRLG